MNRKELILEAERNMAQAAVNGRSILDNPMSPEDFHTYARNLVEFGQLVSDQSLDNYLSKETDEMLVKKIQATLKHKDFSNSLRELVSGIDTEVDIDTLSEMTLNSQKQLTSVKES